MICALFLSLFRRWICDKSIQIVVLFIYMLIVTRKWQKKTYLYVAANFWMVL